MDYYKVEFKKSAFKELKRINKNFVKRVFQKIKTLSINPRPNQSFKLKGNTNSYRLRIGDYRVVYQIDDIAKTVVIFGVGHRKEIYRKL